MPTATPFNNLITFSRGSNATVTGSNGLIQWAPANLLTFSEQFDDATWAKTGATIFPNQDFGNATVGPERVSNGEFTSGTDWALDTGASIGSGLLTFTSVSSTFGASQTVASAFSAGQFAQITVKVDSLTAGQFRIRINGGTYFLVPNTPGTYTAYVQVGSGSNSLQIHASGTTSGTIDFISAKQVTPVAATAPDGTQTADTLVEDNSTGGHLVLVNPAPLNVAQAPVAFTIYAKAGTRRFIALGSNTRDNGGAYVAFDLQNGTSGAPFGGNSSSVTSSSIISVGNGWYRCQMSLAVSSGGSGPRFVAAIVTSLTPTFFTPTVPESYTGNGAGSLLIWGAQAELGSTATTYNPTTVKNLLGFSEAFDNAAWTKTGASIVTGAQANPVNGLFNAQKLMEDTATSIHRTFISGPTVIGTPYVFSAYFKAAGRTLLNINVATGVVMNVTFDVSAGVVTNQTSGIGSITPVGNGWYRVAVSATAIATATPNFQILLVSTGTTTNYTGDGNSGVYIYGAQLSDSASLDPYVPTPGAAPSSTAFYGPRFDFDPVTLQPRGLLVEEQRTNLLVRSEEFDNAAWAQVAVTVSANAAVAPNGTTTADRVVPTATTAQHYVSTQFASAASTYTMTVYAKADGYNWIWFNATATGSPANDLCWFDVANGVTGTAQAGATTSIVSVGNGWYRCVCSWTAFTVGSPVVWIAVASADNQSGGFTGDGVSGAFIWGAQLEAGAFATSYIPTVASTVTRSADVATITGQNFAQWYGPTAGTFIAEVGRFSSVNSTATAAFLSATDNPASNDWILMFGDGLNTTAQYFNNGTTQASMPLSPITSGGKMSFAYALNDFAANVNGGAVSTDTSGTLSTDITVLRIGAFAANPTFLNGHIRSINFIPARAADFQLQAITTQTIVDYFYLQTATGDQLVDGNGDDLYSLPIFG